MLSKRMSRRAAFTLVEVMVVTGIMMSQANNYAGVKNLALQKQCENNLRQLYQGLMMYDMTNGGLPKAKFYPDNPKTDRSGLLRMMTGDYEKLFVCPVFPEALREKGLTYVYNDELAGKSLADIPDPRTTWLMTELNAVSDKLPMPHPGGFHILYADGHVEVTKTLPPQLAKLQKEAEETVKKQLQAAAERHKSLKTDGSPDSFPGDRKGDRQGE